MKFSYNWLKELVDFKETPQELAELINIHITEVEALGGESGGYMGVIVAEILQIDAHPNADKLHLVTLDIGLGKRVTVVCGASNIEVGQKVPLALIGAKLPVGEIKMTTIRGVESTGMICSGEELGLPARSAASSVAGGEKKSAGILVLDKKASVGRPVQEYLNVSADSILDLKILSNRPDYLSYVGIAREIVAVLGKEQSLPLNLTYPEDTALRSTDKVVVKVLDTDVCPKYLAHYVANVEVKESPDWLQQKLISSGVRPISNIVDISNFVMLELGQPVHAFDADKIMKPVRHSGESLGRLQNLIKDPGQSQDDEVRDTSSIIVRRAKLGEQILALDGKTYELNPEVAVIANSEGPIALAGIMGSEPSGVTDLTKDIVIEVATFSPTVIRRGGKSLGLSTDASIRFERGLQPSLADVAMKRMLHLIHQIIPGAKIAAGNVEVSSPAAISQPVEFTTEEIANLIGAKITGSEIAKILQRLGFTANITGKNIVAVPPPWRADIKEKADIAEEVVRIWGIDRVEPAMPEVTMSAPAVNRKLVRTNELKDLLAKCGFSEAPSHCFIGEEWARKLGIQLEDELKISNPLNSQWTHLSSNLWPNLLGFANSADKKLIKIFEIANIFIPSNDVLPIEIPLLSMLVSGGIKEAYRMLRGVVEMVVADMPKLKFVAVPGGAGDNFINILRVMSDREIIGTIEEISPRLANVIDVPEGTVWAEIDIQKLVKLEQGRVRYQEVSRFPSSQFDISVELPSSVSAGMMIDEIWLTSPLIQSVDVFDVYQLPNGGRSLGFRVVVQAADRTLTDAEIKTLESKIINLITTQYRGHLRG